MVALPDTVARSVAPGVRGSDMLSRQCQRAAPNVLRTFAPNSMLSGLALAHTTSAQGARHPADRRGVRIHRIARRAAR
jgi:hypothetical protein